MKMLELPSGNYVNLDLAYRIDFDVIPDSNNTPHQKCRIVWDNYTSNVYSDNDAIFIKNYLDKNDGHFLIHELDHAVQTVGLGVAVQIIQELTGEPTEEISEKIVSIANQRVSQLSPDQIKVIRQNYEDNYGQGIGGSLGVMPLNTAA